MDLRKATGSLLKLTQVSSRPLSLAEVAEAKAVSASEGPVAAYLEKTQSNRVGTDSIVTAHEKVGRKVKLRPLIFCIDPAVQSNLTNLFCLQRQAKTQRTMPNYLDRSPGMTPKTATSSHSLRRTMDPIVLTLTLWRPMTSLHK